ncbi:DnaJ family domain-containing protein [Brevibacterium atlanticum]|uniref:DnaJ family domain-containing protein n=1 Tax=Brevibacterium atlanticum TaxID=2697563 RepID=UPI00142431EC|nr:DUF1992 domain-containing protein [Brevibacterium atlanticum]
MSDQPSEGETPRRLNSLEDRNAVVESALDKAIKRGDFDDLPGLGKPLTGLHGSSDPDWWIKQKMDNEGINGVAPAAFQLRKENAVLDDTIDAFTSESDVRDYLAGFNARVREAVMDLREGPPVFTPPRDVEKEVRAWRLRRSHRTTKTDSAEVAPPSSGQPSTPSSDRPRSDGGPEAVDGDAGSGGSPRRWWHFFRR